MIFNFNQFECSKISKYEKSWSKSYRFFYVILDEKCRQPRKLLFETELYESLKYQPAVAHLNDLLRQQSENAFWTSKNGWILQFLALFLYFLIFSILASFLGVWPSISMSWLDFLPGAVPKSIWAGISSLFRFSCSYSVHVLFSPMCFFDSKNGPQAMGVVQTDPRYP